jgi:hypothetical protein
MSCRIKGEVPRSAIQIPATVAEPPKPEAIKANGCIVDREIYIHAVYSGTVKTYVSLWISSGSDNLFFRNEAHDFPQLLLVKKGDRVDFS